MCAAGDAGRWAFLVEIGTELSIGKGHTMNRLIVIVLVTIACANAVLAQKQASINPASIYHLGGVTADQPGSFES